MNVLALRYDGKRWNAAGRSHCPHCKHTLQWYELIPLASFMIQGGRCRACKARIGWQYPLVELLSALVFVFIPWRLGAPAIGGPAWILSAIWIVAFELLLLVAYIDLLLQIVPDELCILLGVVAIFETIFAGAYLAPGASFLGPYAAFFGTFGNIWLGHAVGALFGGGFFAILVLVTRGKGMGMGDVKLGLPLGFLFGWPDIAFLYAAAFVAGSVIGLVLIAMSRKTRKSAVPFVPFIALGAVLTFFFAAALIAGYFRIIGL